MTIYAVIIVQQELLIYLFTDNIEKCTMSIATRLSTINILYIKVFQSLSLNYDLIPKNINNYLISYLDNAPYRSEDIDYNTLLKISKKYDILYDNTDIKMLEPIGSGMISLVFKGTMNNIPIVIKIKRKNINIILKHSINNILFILNICNYLIYNFQYYELYELVKKNVNDIKEQTNFKQETQNIIKMKQNCINLKYILIPYCYDYITDVFDNVIIMEFINGCTINNIDTIDYEPFARQIIKFGIVSTLIHGFAHGDLHGGNILFIKDTTDTKNKYKLGIIDFGIMHNLDDNFKNSMLNISTEIFSHTSSLNELSNTILVSGLFEPINIIHTLPQCDYKNLKQLIYKLLDDLLNNNKSQPELYNFLFNFNTYISNNDLLQYNIHPSDNFLKAQFSLAMTHGIILKLSANNHIKLINDVINNLFHIDTLNS